ncbi:unnamed protein product [Ixodes persulcatus]
MAYLIFHSSSATSTGMKSHSSKAQCFIKVYEPIRRLRRNNRGTFVLKQLTLNTCSNVCWLRNEPAGPRFKLDSSLTRFCVSMLK